MSANNYFEKQFKDYETVINSLIGLADQQKNFIRSRWLNQLLWIEDKTVAAQKRYYMLRLTAIIGGVLVPALVSLKGNKYICESFIHWITFSVSLLVAMSIAVEEFFHFGERWRHYRRTAELLKTEGWRFFQLSGLYSRYAGYPEAYPVFTDRIEEIVQHEMESYITNIVTEKQEKGQKG